MPHHVQDLDILVVSHRNFDQKKYNCIVNMFHVLASLEYKLDKDPYYMDVPIYHIALLALPLPLPMYSLYFTILTLQIQAQTTSP